MASEGSSRIWLLLIGAIGFGLVAAVFSTLYLKSREEAIRLRLEGERLQMVSVVVAAGNIPKGTQVGNGSFAIRDIPNEYVHADAVYPEKFDALSTRFLDQDLEAGKPLLNSFLVEAFPVDFSDLIKQGLRAVTIEIDQQGSQASMLRPGNRIDLFVNIKIQASGLTVPQGSPPPSKMVQAPEWMELEGTFQQIPPKEILMPVLQDIVVLATGREPYEETLDQLNQPQRRDEQRYNTITIAVSPAQAALTRIAEETGELHAFLRNRADRSQADFFSLSAQDLFTLAVEMAARAKLAAAAAAAGASIDKDGNWVSADGTVIKKENLVLKADGTVTTTSGKLLAAKGISINEKGEYVDAKGNVVDPRNVVVKTADGRFVDANGDEVPENELVVLADGTVTTKAQMLADAGLTVNENGDYVDAKGNVIAKDDVIVLANGTVMTKDGKVLAGPPVTVNEQGFIVAEDGTVMTPDGKILNGLRVNEKGEVVGRDGTKYNARDLVVAADGSVRTRDGKLVSGVSAMTTGVVAAAAGAGIDLILGDQAEDGKAKIAKLPITQ